jgi:hypothetical protein
MSESQTTVPAVNPPAQRAREARQGASVILQRFYFGRAHGTLWQRQNASGHKSLDLSIC